MNINEIRSDIVDLLVEFDEMGFCPTILLPNPEMYAVLWKIKLENLLGKLLRGAEGREIK